MTAILSGAVGALFGILTGLFLEWWKSDRENLNKLCEEFCVVISAAAEIAAEYWLLPGNDQRCPLLETRLYGFQRRITGYNVLVTDRLHDAALDDIQDNLGMLFDSFTGGRFQDAGRPSDPNAARTSQDRSSDAMIAIRRGVFQRTNFRESFARYIQRMWPV